MQCSLFDLNNVITGNNNKHLNM